MGRARRLKAMVRPGWQRIIVVASGPSFDVEQAAQIVAARAAGLCKVIVVNDNWRRVANADIIYASDDKWWDKHHPEVRQSGFAGELWTSDINAAKGMGLRWVQQIRKLKLSQTERLIHGGGNSGHNGLHLAYLLGGERIALVGFDMMAARNPATGQDDGPQHWFGEHANANKLPFAAWIPRIESLAPGLVEEGVEVINCSQRTAIKAFPKRAMASVLRDWEASS